MIFFHIVLHGLEAESPLIITRFRKWDARGLDSHFPQDMLFTSLNRQLSLGKL